MRNTRVTRPREFKREQYKKPLIKDSKKRITQYNLSQHPNPTSNLFEKERESQYI